MSSIVDISDYPIETIRRLFPSLKRFHAGFPISYFDGPGGAQIVESVISSMSQYMSSSVSNLGGTFATSEETASYVEATRKILSDFFKASPDEIAFGQNMTTLNYLIAFALKKKLKAGDEIVVTEMDHRANVDPWLQIAEDIGLTVKWIRLNLESFTLDLSNLNDVINENTKIVAIGHASNGVGTINDVKKVADRAHEVGAITVVDAVHSAPHLPIDRDAMGADIIVCSSYKFFGPHVGIAVIKKELFNKIQTYTLRPAYHDPPGKLETGTQNFEGIVGIAPAIDFISSLGRGQTYRERLENAFALIHAYENFLAEMLRDYLGSMPSITLYQAPDGVEKTPTVAFRVAGLTPKEVTTFLADKYGIFAGAGHFYADTIAELLELPDGWVRVGMAPYNSVNEVDRLIRGLKDLIGQQTS